MAASCKHGGALSAYDSRRNSYQIALIPRSNRAEKTSAVPYHRPEDKSLFVPVTWGDVARMPVMSSARSTFGYDA